MAIGSDHAGFELKELIKKYLDSLHQPYKDFGTDSQTSTDYPDWGAKVASAISNGIHQRGILICGSGIGMSITANKFKGVRAALCTSEYMAEICRKHNDANILVLGGRTTSELMAQKYVKIWLETAFEGGRHQKRIEKLDNWGCF
ncbi:ribose 5-phosphate isomerase B [candidate division KSB1 bacterium]|nr:ribose 5-phosphate isomerase B [candidate division KSB1 bacterium]